jgi:hypothetical protein
MTRITLDFGAVLKISLLLATIIYLLGTIIIFIISKTKRESSE